MNPYLELLGYLGTALVLMSMAMTSLVKLRLFNMAGSLVSLIYALVIATWPVALLNAGMIAINSVQLVRHYKTKGKEAFS